jgi:hypothetical protein
MLQERRKLIQSFLISQSEYKENSGLVEQQQIVNRKQDLKSLMRTELELQRQFTLSINQTTLDFPHAEDFQGAVKGIVGLFESYKVSISPAFYELLCCQFQ